jgi:hypothetical protein
MQANRLTPVGVASIDVQSDIKFDPGMQQPVPANETQRTGSDSTTPRETATKTKHEMKMGQMHFSVRLAHTSLAIPSVFFHRSIEGQHRHVSNRVNQRVLSRLAKVGTTRF